MINFFLVIVLLIIPAELIWKPRLDFNYQTGGLLLWYNTPDDGRKYKRII